MSTQDVGLSKHSRGVIQSATRLVMGGLFAFHGAAGMFGILGMHAAHFAVWPGWWAAVIELVCGLLVAVGFGTRVAAVLCSGAMAFAYFTVHAPHGLLPIRNGGELAALYCWIFLLIAAIGPGPLSLDAVLRRQTPLESPDEDFVRVAIAD